MYTVFRITAPASKVGDLARAIDQIDARAGQVEARLRGDGYVVDLCDQPSWAEHCAAILRFVEPNRDALGLARAGGATLTVDVAVEPEDRQDGVCLSLAVLENVMEALASVAARLVVSIYGDASPGDCSAG